MENTAKTVKNTVQIFPYKWLRHEAINTFTCGEDFLSEGNVILSEVFFQIIH